MKKEKENIVFETIKISGILHPGLIVKGQFKEKPSSLFFKSNHGELTSTVLNLDEKNFYYFVPLTRQDQYILIYLNTTLLLKIKNWIGIRIWNKIKDKSFYLLQKGKEIFRSRKHQAIEMDSVREYNKWLKRHEQNEENKNLNYKPLLSILVPVYNTKKEYLEECLNSILQQTYENFELCIVDDCSTNKETIEVLKKYEQKDKRIKVKYRTINGHISISSNDALSMATGTFIGLVDHDDVLSSNAFYEVVKVLNENKELDFIYTDEDKLNTKGQRCAPHFKPDFSPDTLLGNNYICHFSVIRKSLVEKVGGFAVGLEGAQDHDLFLKISEISTKFYHIPKIVYHWRMTDTSTAFNMLNKSYAIQNGQKAITNALKRRHTPAHIVSLGNGYYQINYQLQNDPFVSIILPTKDNSLLLRKCLESIYEKTTYPHFEVIVINNNSVEKQTFSLFAYYQKNHSNFKVLDAPMEFNYSKMNNLAVKEAKGDYILLLNNDTEVITPNWIEEMVGYASLSHIGAVGVKLLYANQKIQHAGIILGMNGVAQNAFVNSKRNALGIYNRLQIPYNYSAVTAACLMVKKEKYIEVGGLEEKLAVAFNDVDFNLKLVQKGYYNICLPQVELFHYESKSRGYDTTLEKQKRFLQEQNFMLKKWKSFIDNDPMYNKNLSLKSNFMLEKKK